MLYANSTLNDNYHYGKLCIEKGQRLQRELKQVVNFLHRDSIVYQLYRVIAPFQFSSKLFYTDFSQLFSFYVNITCLRFINAQSSLHTGVANISTPTS